MKSHQGRWSVHQSMVGCQRQQPRCCGGGAQCLCRLGSKGAKTKMGTLCSSDWSQRSRPTCRKKQHLARYHQSLCRSNKRTIRMESMFESSRNSQFPTGTRTQGVGVDHKLMDQLFGPWHSPSDILNETFLQI